MMRWLQIRLAIYLMRRARRLRDASERDFDAANKIVGRLYPALAGVGARPSNDPALIGQA